MGKWNDYTTKTALKDNDELMILDKDANANKRTLMDKIWDYVIDKMTTAVIAKLGTTDKTLIGAVNELNSKRALEINSTFINQIDVERKLQFSGYAKGRTVIALLLISSQLEVAPPICISFSTGGGSNTQDASSEDILVSSNTIGVTGGKNGTITIPRYAGDWGMYRIVFLDKGLSVKAIV